MISIGLITLTVLCTCTWVGAYDENPHFCIESEPLLLDDMEPHFVVPTERQLQCHVTAITLTAKEKESFLDTMCHYHGGTHKDDYNFLKLHNGGLHGRGSYHDICKNNASAVLAWVPYQTMLSHYGPELNPRERLSYIAKATNLERETTELCHFRHTDLVNNVSDNLFTCVVMIFEDNFYNVEDNIKVLVEVVPLMYELRNITYIPWHNTTTSYKTKLGNSELKNPSSERKPIYGSINYAFVEKIHVNMSAVYEGKHIPQLPLLFEHRGSVVELDSDGVGGVDVREKAYFGRKMDAKSEVKVEVIGQWVDQHRQFSADIFEYYGSGIKRFKQQLHDGKLTFIRIENTEPVFEHVESKNLAKASIFREKNQPSKSSLLIANNTTSETEWDEDYSDNKKNNHPYPGFYPWFVISCLILATVVVLVLYGIVRGYNKKGISKQEYQVADQCP